MDIHAPHGNIHTWKDFLLQLGTITAGVLIALSLEGVREWNHNRTLAGEARDTIVRELTDNQKGVQSDLRGIADRKKNLDSGLQFADDVLNGRQTSIHSLSLGFSLADLSTASWQTADHTGALAHLTYGEVQKYAAVYALQDLYAQQERRGFEHLSDAIAIVSVGDPTKASRAEIERFRAQLLTLIADLSIEEQLARQLSDRYAKALQH